MATSLESDIDTLSDWLAHSTSTVFLGGAGVSTESGIPDFRSSQGVYTKLKDTMVTPEYLLSHDCLVNDTELFFEYQRNSRSNMDLKPNDTHHVLKKLEDDQILKAIVTQNIDGLHQKAGSRTVYEIHGSQLRHYCMGPARHRFTWDEVPAEPLIPQCPTCSNTIRPDVVLYGEMLPSSVVENAIDAISNADVFIVGGTSLNVYPAAGMLNYYSGNKLALLNLDPTPMDSRADLVIHEKLGDIFRGIAARRWPDEPI